MEILIQEINTQKNSTASMLLLDGRFFCFVLEDGHRDKKVKHETRIPAGRYPVKPATSGRFYERYKRLWGHEFSILVEDVPGFSGILIHTGNTINDTSGCPLVNRFIGLGADGNFKGTDSASVYRQLYDLIKAAFERKEKVFLTVKRFEGNAKNDI